MGRAGVNNLTGRLCTADSYVTVLDSMGAFGSVEPESSRSNEADRFRVEAFFNAPREHPVDFTLYLSGTDYSDSVKLTVWISPMRASDPIPDGPRQPAVYWAYDDSDSGHVQRPVYSWAEIRTQGTRTRFANDDAVVVVDLPPAFGPFYYYGQRYTQLSISVDGWIVPGSYTTSNCTNTGLPSASAPPGAICVNWDDLSPGYNNVTGYTYYYHDATNNRFVVEFDSVKYYKKTIRDKYEVIFYDTTLAAPDGNSMFEFQYMTANGYASNTVGIQDQGRTTAIQCLYGASYHIGCAPLRPQRAIRFTTDPPAGVKEENPGPQAPGLRLTGQPNPFSLSSGIRFSLPYGVRSRTACLCIYDNTGRLVRTLAASGEQSVLVWNGRNETDQAVAPGVYFCCVSGDSRAWTKVVLTQ